MMDMFSLKRKKFEHWAIDIVKIFCCEDFRSIIGIRSTLNCGRLGSGMVSVTILVSGMPEVGG
jgi:hypothetical protein